MKPEWIRSGIWRERRNGSRLSPDATLPASTSSTPAEVERLLAVMCAVQTELAAQTQCGLEKRVLTGLETQAGRSSSGWRKMQDGCSRGWALAAVTAALFCVFTGGLLVARESSLTPGIEQQALAARSIPARIAPAAGSSLMQVAGGRTQAATARTSLPSLTTAAARRKPAAPVSAGRRRGRAVETSAQISR